ncbi:MAG: FimV/HubP family polar landmark protein, partial [Dokdonella sp.]
MSTRSLRIAIAMALGLGAFALTTTDAAALGLGSIVVKSRLNQVLDAEIPIVQEKAGEAAGLIVQLASAEDFERIGLSRSQVGAPLEFTLAKNASGQAVIKVTSKDVVSAPFLDFLIEANWTNGRVLREYTVLLDPPSMAPVATTTPAPAAPPTVAVVPIAATPPTPASSPRVISPTSPAAVAETRPMPPAPRPNETKPVETKPLAEASPPVPVAAAPTPRPQPKPLANAAPPAPKPSAAQRMSDATSYGPVAKGETLSEIARATQPDDSVSSNQVMLALLKANPKAFFGNNINNLRSGAILRIPSADEIRENASMRDAAAKVRAQIDEWRGSIERPTLIAGNSQTPVATQSGKSTASGSKNDAHLALVPPSVGKDSLAANERAGGSASGNNGSANAELARTRETLSAREQETGELRSRVKDLETIKDKNERLISLKDSEIADLQRKLAEAQGTPAPAIPVAPKDTKPAIDTKPAPPKVSSDDIWGKTDTAAPTAPGTTPDSGKPATPDSSKPADSSNTDTSPPPSTPSDSNSNVPPDLAAADGTPTDSNGATSPQADLAAPKPTNSTAALGQPATPVSGNGGEQPWYLDIKVLGMAAITALVAVLLGV